MDAELATRPDFDSPLLAVENFRAAPIQACGALEGPVRRLAPPVAAPIRNRRGDIRRKEIICSNPFSV
jgi:hypothetical protein